MRHLAGLHAAIWIGDRERRSTTLMHKTCTIAWGELQRPGSIDPDVKTWLAATTLTYTGDFRPLAAIWKSVHIQHEVLVVFLGLFQALDVGTEAGVSPWGIAFLGRPAIHPGGNPRSVDSGLLERRRSSIGDKEVAILRIGQKPRGIS